MVEAGDLWKEHFLLGMTQPSFSSPAVLLISKDLLLAFCQKEPEGGGFEVPFIPPADRSVVSG